MTQEPQDNTPKRYDDASPEDLFRQPVSEQPETPSPSYTYDDPYLSGFAAEIGITTESVLVDDPEDDEDDIDSDDDLAALNTPIRYRGATNDPTFGFLIALALSIGLSPLITSGDIDLRYSLSWSVLAVFGVLAWLFGNTARVGQETPDNLIWGVSFGLILGAPLLAFGGGTLTTAVEMLFGSMSTGTLLAYLVFVMPLAETLFFRGILQENRVFWVVGLMGTLWSVVLFFPLMDLQAYPIVGFVICLVLLMMNLIYSYVRQRNGLAAAWMCQLVVNLILIFLPSQLG